MSRTSIRDFHDDDLDGVVRLHEDAGHGPSRPVYALSEVIASCREDHAVVAVEGEHLVGAAVGRAAHAQGWIVFFALADDVAGAEVGARLLDALEHRMAPLGLGLTFHPRSRGCRPFGGLDRQRFRRSPPSALPRASNAGAAT